MYIVMEIQKNGEVISTLVTTYSTKNEAEQKYHQILSAAAVSSVDIHSAVMLTETGERLKSESYNHINPDDTELPNSLE